MLRSILTYAFNSNSFKPYVVVIELMCFLQQAYRERGEGKSFSLLDISPTIIYSPDSFIRLLIIFFLNLAVNLYYLILTVNLYMMS